MILLPLYMCKKDKGKGHTGEVIVNNQQQANELLENGGAAAAGGVGGALGGDLSEVRRLIENSQASKLIKP
jgi:hypothetical protein